MANMWALLIGYLVILVIVIGFLHSFGFLDSLATRLGQAWNKWRKHPDPRTPS